MLLRVINKSTIPRKRDFGPGKKQISAYTYYLGLKFDVSWVFFFFLPYKMEYTSYLLVRFFCTTKLMFIKVIFQYCIMGPFLFLAFAKSMLFLENSSWDLSFISELPCNEYFIKFLFYRLILMLRCERNSGITMCFVFEKNKASCLLKRIEFCNIGCCVLRIEGRKYIDYCLQNDFICFLLKNNSLNLVVAC